MTFDFKPYSPQGFLELAEEVITHQLGKDPVLALYVTEQVVLCTKNVRQAVPVAKHCDSPEEVERFDGGV